MQHNLLYCSSARLKTSLYLIRDLKKNRHNNIRKTFLNHYFDLSRKSTGPRGLISKNFAKKQNLSADNRPNRDSRRRDKSASRDRSISPFVVAMQNYDKFKKMEAAMLKNVTTRKEV